MIRLPAAQRWPTPARNGPAGRLQLHHPHGGPGPDTRLHVTPGRQRRARRDAAPIAHRFPLLARWLLGWDAQASWLAGVKIYFAPLLGILLALVPWAWLLHKRGSRLKKFASQLPEALELVARRARRPVVRP